MDFDVESERNTQNWRNYRTEIKGFPAIVSANLDLLSCHFTQHQPILARSSFLYIAEEDGLPSLDKGNSLFSDILNILTQATALDNVVYAGHVLSQSRADIYFYVADENSFIETLEPFVNKEMIEMQKDPQWDVYFDFLMPSLLEDKFSLTEELIDSLSEIGIDLSEPHHIEHRFHFTDFRQMMGFIEQFNHSGIDFMTIKHTEQTIKFEENAEAFYLLKLDQYLRLDNQDIYQVIEKLLELISDIQAEYIGWTPLEAFEKKGYLN